MKSRFYPDYHAKVVEPVKRNKDGCRWIVHRFPIKGGISLRDAIVYDMMNQPNPFISMLEMARVPTQGETT
jgi:hypothetical protein